MILLLAGGLLFFFLASSIGFYFNLKRDGKELFEFELLKGFLSGTMLITVYLNILSFFFPVNYLLLLPLLVFTAYIFFATSYKEFLLQEIYGASYVLFSKRNALITVAFVLALGLYTLVPPYNTDSSGYHFLSILWNEKYKLIPGLANLYPQFGYNSSFFVLSAAFSFTDLAGQSIYPINWVLSVCFFLWMLKKSFSYADGRRWLLWLILMICLRQFPINLASPSADNLASILVFYILFTAAEKGVAGLRVKQLQSLLLLACFAVIIKLSTLPLLLLALIPLFDKQIKLISIISGYSKIAPFVLLIIVPWLFRNILLSGYLIFPFPSLNLFDVDWKVPVDVAVAERLHISHAPRMIQGTWNYVDTLPFFKWFPEWLSNTWKDNLINGLLISMAICTSIIVLIIFLIRKMATTKREIREVKKERFFTDTGFFSAWLIALSGFVFWMFTSPDIRFGYAFALMIIILPLISLSVVRKVKVDGARTHYTASMLIICACIYYHFLAIKRLQPYSVKDYVIKPLKSEEYFKNNDLTSFKYVMLNKNVKLYIHDASHHAINAPLPSCSPYQNGLMLRGDSVEDGFMIKGKK